MVAEQRIQADAATPYVQQALVLAMVEPDVHGPAPGGLCQQVGDTVNRPVTVTGWEKAEEGHEGVGMGQVKVEAAGLGDGLGGAARGQLIGRTGQCVQRE
ncbi:hypothetical protein [Streptomyces mirabilis]|uniref:hypothetical protein n=1 Tax=Streptomyces mirabilis TaxID=68239 RepID=UPI00331EA995